MANNPPCENCGGTDYILESGFYFCSECSVQSQQLVEQVYEHFAGQKVSVAPKSTVQEEKKDKKYREHSDDSTKQELTTWEALNYVIVGLVEELIHLGAKSEFKKIALKLWAEYLKNLEVAFISTTTLLKPRLGVWFRAMDAELLFGAPEEITHTHRKPLYRPPKRKYSKKSSFKSNSSVTSLSSRARKKKLKTQKTALAHAEYMETSSVFSSQLSFQSSQSLPSEISSRQTNSQKSFRLKYTKHAKNSFRSLLENAKDIKESKRKRLQKLLMCKEKKSIRHVSMVQVVAIIKLALTLADDDIQFADIRRWSDEGYLSTNNVQKLLPNNKSVSKDLKGLFANFPSSRTRNQSIIKSIIRSLELSEIKVNLIQVIERYCFELCLPEQIMNIINKLNYLRPIDCPIKCLANLEGRAMAMIIFVLKLLFGLDGVTERNLSQLADLLNSNTKKEISFNWMKWVKFINARGALCAKYHSSLREKIYPNSRVGGPEPFLSQWDNTPTLQTLDRVHVIQPSLKEALRKTIKNLMNETVEPMPPSKSPMSLILSIILHKRDLDIPITLMELLKTDFSQHSLDYLLSSEIDEYLKNEFNCEIDNNLGGKFIFKEKFNFFHRVIKENKYSIQLKISNKSKDDNQEKQIENNKYGKIKKTSRKDLYYIPRHYWLIEKKVGELFNIGTLKFESLACETFPESFLWLLRECARIIEQPINSVYSEFLVVQKCYLNKNN